jgi:acid phosphatase family membrane protein YuiD
MESVFSNHLLIIGIIVIRDALGIRRQAGEHAKALNTLVFSASLEHDAAPDNHNAEKKFCESIGHKQFCYAQ